MKIAPDLGDDDIDAIAELAVELGLDGIIVTNTTISRDHLTGDAAQVAALGAGGLSGTPLKQRALEVLRRLHARTGGRVLLVASGGIETADDASTPGWPAALARPGSPRFSRPSAPVTHRRPGAAEPDAVKAPAARRPPEP